MKEKPVSVALGILSLCFFAMGTASLSVVGALQAMSSSLGISRSAAALLVPAFAVTFAVAAPAIQIVAGHWVRRRLLLCGLLVLAAGALGCAAAPGYPALIVARIVTGLGAAAVSPMVSSLGAALVPPQRQGHALAVVFSGITLASVLGVPLASWCAAMLGWRLMFAAIAGLAVLAALLVVALVKDQSRAQPIRPAQLWRLLTNATTAGGLGITALGMAALFTTYTMITPILRDHFAAGAGAVSFVLLLYGVAGILGNWLARYVALKWTSERSIAVALLLLTGGFAVLRLAPPWLPLAILALIPCAVAVDIFAPAQQRRMVELAPDMRGLVLALNSSALFGGMAGGACLAGRIVPIGGLMALPVVSIALAAACLLLLWISKRGAAPHPHRSCGLKIDQVKG
jgi:predicted MFS family arabinose efflux permease